jgi:hypothetical protein
MNSIEKIQELAEEVVEGKIGMVEAILSLPEDLSDCEGRVEELDLGNL